MSSKKGVVCHIQFNGKPLCYFGSLPKVEGHCVTCSYISLAEANRIKKELQKLDQGYLYKVVRGGCPAYEAERKNKEKSG